MEEVKFSRRREYWENLMYPIRKVCTRIAIRIGIRKSGLLKLRHDVRTCEYEDIHVMWELLHRTESEISQPPPYEKRKKRQYWKLFRWARCAMCRPCT